ncbi:NAD(P)-binding domain-containing protein [Sulfitobacter mediterraneus]|uniref:NAD(P)-binding domain-containing protein n=1 Tax=Sulfitobacter mediterraneus TaxID=83219 RepID=UPI0019330681|nr:NAD(P)-binding domain-containing protein [Sulfitobacter mediterraneus]MBM1634177.1 NAD(P)-binding domain-containing protein [Sulfitobacter mediterraneus]MBM1641308.1 NAD(P)-binding domain-containing protein [Sulfitobacter mediterraneus]MBM1646042.1 NAD(P)-binding domain-containing protein [Sulfitobacter mediterraneus]MBM1649427.1 NAD(P)-binding domain-containing protein [Sulfitobacter mediterraneus]MBM1654110.1 NAD(P)-binding domain-containing protein [Sulfitobacter mediterraneus]
MRIGFIGTGEIAAAMVRGLAGRGHQIMVSERNAQVAAQLAAEVDGATVAANADVVAGSDVVFLCLMADVARQALPSLPFRADQAVISVMVDVSHETLQQLCAPATDIAMTIPLSAISTGGSMLPVYPASTALTALFGDSDHVFAVASEAALNAHFAGSALSAPLIALMQTGAQWLGDQTGDPKAAEGYVAGVFAGFLRQMATSDADFDTLLQGLATEGGLNASLKAHMQETGAHDALVAGLEALKPRLGL